MIAKKRWCAILLCCVVVCAALCGCMTGTAGKGSVTSGEDNASVSSSSAASTDAAPTTSSPYFVETPCRVVYRQGDTLLLAALDGPAEVFTLSLTGLPDEEGSFDSIEPGCAVVVRHTGGMQETYPACFDTVLQVSLFRGLINDLCVLYLQVLEDLWAADPGLNEGISMIAVDLSATGLTPAEQTAVAWQFAQNHGVELILGDYETLKQQGYLTPDDPTNPNSLYHWTDGCAFSITELELDGVYHGLRPVKFTATKWRGSLAAYLFCDCTAVQSGSGRWSEYTVGSYAIA